MREFDIETVRLVQRQLAELADRAEGPEWAKLEQMSLSLAAVVDGWIGLEAKR
jgi:hypothetical protein